jgi:hypothetical protein
MGPWMGGVGLSVLVLGWGGRGDAIMVDALW